MVGGAETALLTLDNDNQPGGPGGESFTGVQSNNAPKKFLGFQPTYIAMKAIINKFDEIKRPTKKDVKIAASGIFDVYNKASVKARGLLDSSVPLNGFVEELGQVVSISPADAHYFFDSLVKLVDEFNPKLIPKTPVLTAQANLGSGKPSCGCCNGCGGNKPEDKKEANTNVAEGHAMTPPSNSKSAPSGNVVANILDWIKKKKNLSGSMQQAPKKESLEDVVKKEENVAGSGKSILPGRTLRKRILPGRTRNVMDDSSSDDSSSSSDDELTGGNKAFPDKLRRAFAKVIVPKLRADIARVGDFPEAEVRRRIDIIYANFQKQYKEFKGTDEEFGDEYDESGWGAIVQFPGIAVEPESDSDVNDTIYDDFTGKGITGSALSKDKKAIAKAIVKQIPDFKELLFAPGKTFGSKGRDWLDILYHLQKKLKMGHFHTETVYRHSKYDKLKKGEFLDLVRESLIEDIQSKINVDVRVVRKANASPPPSYIKGVGSGRTPYPNAARLAKPVPVARDVPQPTPPSAPVLPEGAVNSAIATVKDAQWAKAHKARGSGNIIPRMNRQAPDVPWGIQINIDEGAHGPPPAAMPDGRNRRPAPAPAPAPPAPVVVREGLFHRRQNDRAQERRPLLPPVRHGKKGRGKPNKRAEIVKSVMKKRGVSMIEASKIVKAEGLY